MIDLEKAGRIVRGFVHLARKESGREFVHYPYAKVQGLSLYHILPRECGLPAVDVLKELEKQGKIRCHPVKGGFGIFLPGDPQPKSQERNGRHASVMAAIAAEVSTDVPTSSVSTNVNLSKNARKRLERANGADTTAPATPAA